MIIAMHHYDLAPEDFPLWGAAVMAEFYTEHGELDFQQVVALKPYFYVVRWQHRFTEEAAEEIRDPDKAYAGANHPVGVYRLTYDKRRGKFGYVRDELASIDRAEEVPA